MKQSFSVGIDIGSATTRVVVSSAPITPGGLPQVIAHSAVETRGCKHGYVLQREDVTTTLKKALREAETQAGIKIKQATIAIGGVGLQADYAMGTAVVSRADSIIGKLDIEKAITEAEGTLDLKNRAILHAYPVVFKIDGKEHPVRPEGIQGLKLEVKVLFITCFQQHIDDLLGVLQDAGVRVLGFTATPLATHHLLLTDLQRNFGCALIDVGAETVSVSVFENNIPTSLHVFGIGSLDITKDIALGLRITPEEAESVKRGSVSFQSIPKKKLDEIIEARLSDIFELIDKYLKKIGRSGLLPAGAVLIGGGAYSTQIEAVAKTMLKIPVKLGALDIPSIKGPIKDQRLITAYAVSLPKNELGGKKNRTPDTNDNEGFVAVIKNFFKQLMP